MRIWPAETASRLRSMGRHPHFVRNFSAPSATSSRTPRPTLPKAVRRTPRRCGRDPSRPRCVACPRAARMPRAHERMTGPSDQPLLALVDEVFGPSGFICRTRRRPPTHTPRNTRGGRDARGPHPSRERRSGLSTPAAQSNPRRAHSIVSMPSIRSIRSASAPRPCPPLLTPRPRAPSAPRDAHPSGP